MEYLWYNDEVQTARILFYLRVIPTCIARLPSPVFGKVVAPTMFLYPILNNLIFWELFFLNIEHGEQFDSFLQIESDIWDILMEK